MTNKSRLFIALTLSVLTTSALANDVSYDYLELRFADTEIENADGDGFELGLSYNLNDNWIVIGSYLSQDFDFNIDLTGLELGVGYVWAIDEQFDVYATGSYADYEVDVGSFGSDSEDGFRFVGGIRSRINEKFEARAAVNYFDLGDSDTFVELAGDYYFTPEFAAGISIDVGGDVDTITFGGRWFFGGRRIR